MRSGFPPVFRFGNVSIIWRPRSIIVCFGLLLAATIVAMLLLGTGSQVQSKEVLETLLGATQNPAAERIVLGVRLPRVLTAALVGACLGAAGSIFQSISRNPLGSPDILGFTTGAATGAIVQIILLMLERWRLRRRPWWRGSLLLDLYIAWR